MTFTNSPLAVFRQISPNRNSPRSRPIRKITIHHTAGVISIENLGGWFARPSTQASSNYGVGNDGRIGLYVEERDRSWCSSSPENDHQAITIEVSNSAAGGQWPVSDAALTATIGLCVDVCQRNGIERLNYTGTADGNLTRHDMFRATVCPGPYLGGRLPFIVDEVNRRLGATAVDSVADAIETLRLNGVIGSPEYWLENYGRLQYLDRLLINMANKIAFKA